MRKRQLGPCVTFFPQPTTLISTVGSDGRTDLMTASWVSIVSKTPPVLGVSLHRGRLTYEHIRQTGSFAVNAVPSGLCVEADFCGLRSGREEDKAAKAGIEFEKALHIEAPLVALSPLNVECRYLREVELGEYRLVLGEILEIHAVEKAFSPSGAVDVRAFDPLVYLGGIREYWRLGEKAGTAYQDGKKLFSLQNQDESGKAGV